MTSNTSDTPKVSGFDINAEFLVSDPRELASARFCSTTSWEPDLKSEYLMLVQLSVAGAEGKTYPCN